jgi:hypothetical protein
MERFASIEKADYVPVLDDVLRGYRPTTGIVERGVDFAGSPMRVVDLGGSRPERRKWLHSFSNTAVVAYCAALSEYDLTLAEDAKTNRLMESLNLFEEVCNARWFNDSAIVVL